MYWVLCWYDFFGWLDIKHQESINLMGRAEAGVKTVYGCFVMH